MGERDLKSGWRRVKFGDVVRLSSERIGDPLGAGIDRYVGLEHIDPGDLRIRRAGSVSDGTTFTTCFRPGQVLFGKRRAYQRKVAVADFRGVCSGDIYVLEQRSSELLPELLPHICQTDAFLAHAIETSAGSLSPRTKWESLAEFCLALPPLNEQQRLAQVLDASMDQTEALTAAASAAIQLWEAAASDAFAFDSPVWEHDGGNGVRLGDVLKYASDGPFGSKLKTEHYADCGVRVVRLQNIERLRFDDSDKAFIGEQYFCELRDYSVCAGDVLIAGLGDERIPPGRACIVPFSLGPAINKADCFCLRPTDDLIPGFLVQYLCSGPGLRQSASLAQGTTRKRLNLGNIRRMRVPKPPLSVQHEVSHKLGTLFTCASELRRRLAGAMQLHVRLREALIGG